MQGIDLFLCIILSTWKFTDKVFVYLMTVYIASYGRMNNKMERVW